MIFCNIPLQESLYEKKFRSTINLYQQDFKAINLRLRFNEKKFRILLRGGGIQERIFKTLIFKCLLRILYINHKIISSAEFLFLCTYINKIGYIRFGVVF